MISRWRLFLARLLCPKTHRIIRRATGWRRKPMKEENYVV